MKKILLFIASFLVLNSFALESAVYGSLSSIDQLTVTTLDAGQFAYYENDGAIEMFAGAKDESKNLRVCDPAALSGYRLRSINSELSVSHSDNLTIEDQGVFKFSNAASHPYEWVYDETFTTNSISEVDYFIKNGDTYTQVTIPAGTDLSGGGYYTRSPHWYCQLVVYSKDAQIYNLDFDITERPSGGLMDFFLLNYTSSITYSGSKATIDIDISGKTENTTDWITISNFRATTIAIGDRVHTTDLQTTKIYIYDDYAPKLDEESSSSYKFGNRGRIDELNKITPGGFDLSKLRTWVQHLYDGNRGEDWGKYPSRTDVQMTTNRVIKFLSDDVSGNFHDYLIGSSGAEFYMIHNDLPWLRYTPYSAQNPVVETNECVITAIRHLGDKTTPGEIDFSFLYPVTPSKVVVLYRPALENGYWLPITSVLNYNSGYTEYTATIPLSYNLSNRGFWKIVVQDDPSINRIRMNATVSLLASDGLYYKLTFPSGGGTVTAVLDDKQN